MNRPATPPSELQRIDVYDAGPAWGPISAPLPERSAWPDQDSAIHDEGRTAEPHRRAGGR